MLDLDFLAENYLSKFPLELKRGKRWIGAEREFPVIDQDGQPFDVRSIFPVLVQGGWKPYYDDCYSDVVLGVEKDGVNITTDAGYCTLEIGLPPLPDLWKVVGAFDNCMRYICKVIYRHGGLVLGYGIQPCAAPSDLYWVKKRRHEVVRTNYPESINNVTITAAHQTHVDITQAEVVQFTNVYNALAGLMIILCANSPVWSGGIDEKGRLAVREDHWSFSNGGRVGVPYEKFRDINHLMSYVCGLKMLVTQRGKGEYFAPGVNFGQYLSNDGGIESFESRYLLHEGTVWFCARPRVPYGTIEVRPCCTQPQQENIAVDALTLGIAEVIDEVEREIVGHFSWQDWRALRENAIFFGFDAKIDGRSVIPYLSKLLDLAEKGLIKRGLHEKSFLAPLYGRLVAKRNPAHQAVALFSTGGTKALIDKLCYRF